MKYVGMAKLYPTMMPLYCAMSGLNAVTMTVAKQAKNARKAPTTVNLNWSHLFRPNAYHCSWMLSWRLMRNLAMN